MFLVITYGRAIWVLLIFLIDFMAINIKYLLGVAFSMVSIVMSLLFETSVIIKSRQVFNNLKLRFYFHFIKLLNNDIFAVAVLILSNLIYFMFKVNEINITQMRERCFKSTVQETKTTSNYIILVSS